MIFYNIRGEFGFRIFRSLGKVGEKKKKKGKIEYISKIREF